MTENDIQKAVKAHCEANNILYIENRNEYVKRRANNKRQKGLPDMQIIHNGKSLFLEIKNIGTSSKTYAEQVEWRDRLTKAGCPAYVTYGYDDTINKIKQFTKADKGE